MLNHARGQHSGWPLRFAFNLNFSVLYLNMNTRYRKARVFEIAYEE